MAVYTELNKSDIDKILEGYSIGTLENFFPIEEGIENTNYKIKVGEKKYILTIFEKRVDQKDLPFFCNLTLKLFQKGFKCPQPIHNNQGEMISDFKSKKLTILTFIEGKSKKNITPDNCKEIGIEAARLHVYTSELDLFRENSLSISSWKNLYQSINFKSTENRNLKKIIQDTLNYLEDNWPQKLPKGIIHADLFKDNIIFEKEKVNGIIDFTFACNDFYAFEIAICLNALCFDGHKNNLSFNVTKARNFIKGYNSIRSLSDDEKKYIKILSVGSALRFLLTRLYDLTNTPDGALVKTKDPIEYLKRLEFHRNVKNFDDYN